MAKRTTYGRTPWGEYFIHTLQSHNDEGRLRRGKTYANTGRVAKLTVTGPKVSAMVEGNYQPWYRVSLNFPDFEEEEKRAVLELIRSKPRLLAAIGTGELPMELVDELAAAQVDLLPRNWSRLKRSCNCPDSGDPCKHMAAVYYVLAQEIDQNPFSLFLLRGLDLRKEFPFRDDAVLAPPLGLKKRELPWTPPASSPSLSLQDNYLAFQLALLKPAPSFSSRDFKVVLAEFLHFRQRRYESVLAWGPVQTERSLSESEFSLTGSVPAKGQNWHGELPGLEAAHPVLGTASGAMTDFCARFLACSSDQGTATYRFFFHLYRAFFVLLRAGAWVPVASVQVLKLKILWKPLSSVPEVDEQMERLASLAPPLFWADGRSTVEFLLGVLGTEFVHRLKFLPTGSKRLDPVDAVFFSSASLQTSSLAYQSTPLAMASWLAVLDQRPRIYRYRFSLRSARNDGYQLAVSLRKADPDSEESWTSLHEASTLADPVEALRFSVMLASYLPELIFLQTKAQVLLSEERLVAFLGEASSVLTRLGVEVQLPKELSRVLKPQLTVAVKTKTSGNLESFLSLPEMLDYQWSVAVGGQVFTKAEFQALVKRSRGLIRLKDGYLTLDPEEIRRWLEPPPRAPGFRDALAAFLDGGPAFSTEARSLCENLFRQKTLAPPVGLKATLRPYQASGLTWVWNNLMNGFGCLLADDMGLGKTIQTIGVIAQFKETGRLSDPCLVVVPASLVTNWQRELARFAPVLAVTTFHGLKRRLPEKTDVLISTYETVLRDIPLLAERAFSLLILDEAHGLKNVNAKKSQSIRRLNVPLVVALSGTPVENRLEDLRAIFDLVMPGYLGPADEFRQQWRIPIELHRNADQAARLKRITSPFMLRRLKTDPEIVSDLPPKMVIDEYATLSKPQAVLYGTVLEELAGDAAFDDPSRRNALVLKLLTALKQVCNHPRAYDGESPIKAELSGKTMLLKELLSSLLENGEKVIVFSQYVETLKLLEHVIRQDLGEASLVLHGGMSPAERTRSVDRFQTDPASKIFLISLKAGGVGLNLTAASRVIHYDLWYNPAVENQATDRAFRIGQTRQVFVHRLICSGTFEEKIDAMIKAKQELADLSVAQGESWLADLASDDLKSLFRLPNN